MVAARGGIVLFRTARFACTLAISLAMSAMGLAIGFGREGSPMSTMESYFGPVELVGETASTLLIKMSSSDVLALNKDKKLFELWRQIIERRISANEPVFIRYHKDSRTIDDVLGSYERRIELIERKQADNRVNIVIFMAPSIYYVSNDNPRFDSVMTELQKSLDKQAPVYVVNDPDTLEILDARAMQ
jgi:hypothetical protein